MGRPTHGFDRRKQSFYFPKELLAEIKSEADRQDRSLSWVMQQAWLIAREQIATRYPSVPTQAAAAAAREAA